MNRWAFIFLVFATVPFNLLAEKNPFDGFIENKGQWDNSVKFRKKVPQGFLLLQETGWTYYLSNNFDGSHAHAGETKHGALQESATAGLSQAISTTFLGANSHPSVSSMQAQSYYHNFFLGTESHWASRVSEYNEVQYCELYDKIDMKMLSYQGAFKYDLIVSAGGNTDQIVMDWKGCGDMYLQDGNLIVETEFGQMVEQKPFAYQLVAGDTLVVAAQFKLHDRQVSFEFPEGYNEAATLIIDPLLVFSTYSGSSADNWGNTATFDEDGNTYAGGIIFGASTGIFVPQPGVFQESFHGTVDAVIMKFDSLGSQLLYASYLGGSHRETPVSMIVNHRNDLVVIGVTSSTDFPTTSQAFQLTYGGGNQVDPLNDGLNYLNGTDLFACTITADGTSLKASTYLGGSENDGIIEVKGALTLNYGDQFRGEVNIDDEDNIYIASSSPSADFPMANQILSHKGQTDGLLLKMNPDLSSMKWGTFIGGDSTDVLFSVKVDGKGGVYAAGGTASKNMSFPFTGWQTALAGNADGYVVHINEATRAIDAATYLGSTATDQAYLMDLDTEGNVYVLGQTKGTFPIVGDAYINPGSGQFLQKLSSNLQTTIWSTVFGSGTLPPNISPTAFLVSDCNNIYISGWGGGGANRNSDYKQGSTAGMPLTADAFQSTTDGADFYLMVLEPDATDLLYATYFGGIPGTDHVDGGTSRFDKRGVVHHAVCAGCIISNNPAPRHGLFPTTEGAWSTTNGSSQNCNLGVFKFDLSVLKAEFSTNTPDLQNPDIREGCAPFEFLFTNESAGGETYFWDLGDGAVSTNADTVRHSYQSVGEYTITLTVTSPNTCKNTDVTSKKLVLTQGTYTLSPSTTICYGETVQLEATGGTSYDWTPNNQGLSATDISNPVANTTAASTTYFVTIYNEENKCTFKDSLTINVLEEITITKEIEAIHDCSGVTKYSFSGTVEGTDLGYWDFGDGTASTELTGIHEYTAEGIFTARLVAPNELCVEEAAETVKALNLVVPNAFSPNGDGINERFEINYITPLPLNIVDRTGKVIYQNSEYTNQWDGGNLPTGIYYYDILLPDFSTCNGWVQLLR